jgi:hypothetical protein
MTHHVSKACNSREESLESKKEALGKRDGRFISLSKILGSVGNFSQPHEESAAKMDTSSVLSSLNEHDIIESVSWTKKLDKFLKKPPISTCFESYVFKSSAANSAKPALKPPILPKVKHIGQEHNFSKNGTMTQRTMTQEEKLGVILPLHVTIMEQGFLDQADSADRILSNASKRHITPLELKALRKFTQSQILSSDWYDETDTCIEAIPSASSGKLARRGGLLRIPRIKIPSDFKKGSSATPEKDRSLSLSQRSDVSVPAYIFDEQKSSKILPDFRRIDRRRIIRQQLQFSGAVSLLGPNEQSDSDPCSDECESSEKERISLLNAHKPTLLYKESGIETVEHDELNAYNDFGYPVSYQRVFAEEMTLLSTHQTKHSTHEIISFTSPRKSEVQCVTTSMPETSINWKTSMEFMDAPASEYCRFCALHKLPIYNSVIRASSTHSHHKNVSFAGDTIHAIAHYFKHASKTIKELVIISCSLGNKEFVFMGATCFDFMRDTLVCVKLVDCNFSNGGTVLSENLARLDHLSSIQLSDCKMRDTDCACVFIGLAQNNSKCTSISLDHNCAATASADAISQCFRYERCYWKNLDLSWNRMSPSRSMCSSIRHCDHLTELNLSWNGLRDEIALNAMCYALRFHPQIRHINLQNCGLGDKHALLLTELLNDCVKLASIDLRSNPINSYGCRSILRVLGLRHQKAQNHAQGSEICNVMLPLSGSIAESLVDYDTFAGLAHFSLSNPSDRHILKRLLFKRERRLVSFAEDSFRIDGKDLPVSIDKMQSMLEKFETCDMEYHNSMGIISSLNVSENRNLNNVLESSSVTLIIQNMIQTPTEDMLATLWEINFVKSIHSSVEFSVEQKAHVVTFLLGGSNVFRLEQLKELIFLLKPGYRMEAVKLAMTHCWETNGSEQLLGCLSTSEQKKVEMMISEELLHFAPNNPTGHYRLMLSNRFDRDICFKLLAIRNDILEVLKRDKSYQDSRHKIEKVVFNVKLEGSPFTITSDWNVPNNGTLELDFVYCLHPDPSAFTVVDDETIFGFTMVPASAQRKQIKILRSLSNQYFFTCTQAMRVLQYFRDDSMKIESIVILFSRIIDFPGFQRIVKSLDGPKQVLLRKRLGSHNIYVDCSAVGFHELDLSDPQQRYVCGRLVDLAAIEPGENMCGCRYNEIDFDVPSSWLEEIPQKGVFTVFYCRSAQVIKKIFHKIPHQCIPNNLDLLSPSGTEWVAQAKRSRIKLKLSLAFSNVEEAFKKMDEDGGGSLSRLEFSRGLRMLGVQVTAYELLDLVDLLDADGSGFIELEEMVSFWESC